MEIVKLGHNETYTLMTAQGCYTFFDEVIPNDNLSCVELRAHTYVSGALYGDNAAEFLKAWEESK